MVKRRFTGNTENNTNEIKAMKIETNFTDRNDRSKKITDAGLCDTDYFPRMKPGPKRKEPQGRISIPGPERVINEYRLFCKNHNITLWEGLDILLSKSRNDFK